MAGADSDVRSNVTVSPAMWLLFQGMHWLEARFTEAVDKTKILAENTGEQSSDEEPGAPSASASIFTAKRQELAGGSLLKSMMARSSQAVAAKAGKAARNLGAPAGAACDPEKRAQPEVELGDELPETVGPQHIGGESKKGPLVKCGPQGVGTWHPVLCRGPPKHPCGFPDRREQNSHVVAQQDSQIWAWRALEPLSFPDLGPERRDSSRLRLPSYPLRLPRASVTGLAPMPA